MFEPGWAKRRAEHRGLHGRSHVNRQRRIALFLILTGAMRVLAWTTLIALYLLGVSFTASLFQSVAFVAVISLYANAATDFGQVCASLAQLVAGDAHADVEHTRRALSFDTKAILGDVRQIAALQPGPEAEAIVARIAAQIGAVPE